MKPPDTPIGRSFIARFGADDAARVYGAALSHRNAVHDNEGTDAFAWAVFICIGYECFGCFASYHGLTCTETDVRNWIAENSEALGEYQGDVDYLSLFTGEYGRWLSPKEAADDPQA